MAALFIVIDPNIIHNPSFCLSFLAVMGIALVQKEDVRNPLIASLLVGLYATSFTLPYVVYKFGMFNIFSILNTILYSPAVSLMIVIGMVILFFLHPLSFRWKQLLKNIHILSKFTNHIDRFWFCAYFDQQLYFCRVTCCHSNLLFLEKRSSFPGSLFCSFCTTDI